MAHRGEGRGRPRGKSNANQGDYQLSRRLAEEQENISHLKSWAYKNILWALRLDYRQVNLNLDNALVAIRAALGINLDQQQQIFHELQQEMLREPENQKQLELVYATNNTTEPDVAYNEHLVGRILKVRGPKDDEYKDIVVIDYDMANKYHFLFHIKDEVYEWLNLYSLSAEDIKVESEVPQNDVTISFYNVAELEEQVKNAMKFPSPARLNAAEFYLKRQISSLERALDVIENLLYERSNSVSGDEGDPEKNDSDSDEHDSDSDDD